MLKKISSRLIFSYLSLTVLLVFLIFLFLGSFIRKTHININIAEMSGYDEFIHHEIDKILIKPAHSGYLIEKVSEIARITGLRITLIRPDGTVIADSDVDDHTLLENHQYRKEVTDALASGKGVSTRYSSTLKTDMLYHASYNGELIVRLAKPLHEVEKSIQSLRDLILNVSLVAIAFSILMIIVVSLKIAKPFKETLSFASDFASGNYKRRILNYNNDEVGLLQRALNTMADTIVATIDDHILEQKKLEATLASISDGIAMIDLNKEIVIYNDSFLAMLGITEEMKKKQYFEVIRNSTLNAGINKSLNSGKRDSFYIEMSNDRTFEAVINPIKGAEVIQGILIVLHDISEKRKIEKIKSDLVSNVSHELKTPIAIVRGYLETVKENYDNKNMSMSFIDRAIENVDRQDALIQDIIKLSMIESVRDFEKERIDLKIIIERSLELLAPKISRKEIKLINNLSNSAPYTITGNKFLVEEIFFNIIDNGINYNREKGTLSIDSYETESKIMIKISDTGVGIPEEFKDRIFERFYRVDKSRSRGTGGTGLGLSIVKHAAMVLGWDITVDSEPEGTSFTVYAVKS